MKPPACKMKSIQFFGLIKAQYEFLHCRHSRNRDIFFLEYAISLLLYLHPYRSIKKTQQNIWATFTTDVVKAVNFNSKGLGAMSSFAITFLHYIGPAAEFIQTSVFVCGTGLMTSPFLTYCLSCTVNSIGRSGLQNCLFYGASDL